MAISVLQEGQNSTGVTPVTSVSVTLTGVTAGSFVHVIGTVGFIGRSVVFTDSNSDTPAVLGSAGDTTDTQTLSHAWFGPVASGSITFTVAASITPTPFNAIWAREIGQCSGVQASSNITVTAATTAATVSTQPALWSGFGENFAGGTTPTATTGTQDASGWTFGGATGIARTSHARVTATGSVSATFTSASGACVAIFTEAAGGVTVALTGQSASFGGGALTPTLSKVLTGISVASTSGLDTPVVSKALTGIGIATSSGILTPSIVAAIVGSSAAFGPGTVTPNTGGTPVTAALTGISASFVAGSLTPALQISLSGNLITTGPGAVSPATSVALVGIPIGTASGALAPLTTVGLVGLNAVFGSGSLTPTVSLGLTGIGMGATPGSGSPTDTAALLGQNINFFTGILVASGGTPVAGNTVPIVGFVNNTGYLSIRQ